MKKIILIHTLIFLSIFAVACSSSKEDKNKKFSVGVFVTGVVAGNPPYEMMVSAAKEIDNENIEIKIFEAGYNQAEWEDKLTLFVSEGSYDIILVSNPAMPEICERVGKKFQNQKFIITDSYLEGNNKIATFMFNQYEQSYILGYAAGLISESKLKNIESSKKIGFIIAQEYPLMIKHILPGFIDGARIVNSDYELDLRVVGNWYDAVKAGELAKSIMNSKVNVTGVIAGGASVGAIKAVEGLGKYIVMHNTDEYSKAPGTILACGFIEQKRLTKEVILSAYEGTIEYGTFKMLGIKEGYVGLIEDNELYQKYMPKEIKEKLNILIEDIKSGKIILTTPAL